MRQMRKISIRTIKIAFIAGVLCSALPGSAVAQSPAGGIDIAPDGNAIIANDGIAPVTSKTTPNPLPKKTHNWYGVPGTGSDSYTADRFFNTYYSNPASDAFESYTAFTAKCGTKSLDADDKRKILLECKSLPTPYNLVCAANIVRKLLSNDTDNVCRHHAVMMNQAAETLGFKATFEGGWPSSELFDPKAYGGHAWSEVTAYGKRYIIDAFSQEYYSMDGPVSPYCGNNKKEEGEACDGRDNPCGEGIKCEACECAKKEEQEPVGMGPKTKYAVGGALAVGAAILLSNSSDSNSNDTDASDTGSSTDVPASSPPEQPSEATPEPIGDSRDGNYNVSTSVISNPANHPVLIQNLILQLQIVDAVITITQISNNNNFPRQFTAALAAGAFNAIANGNYAGFSTVFQLVGTINALNQLTFQIIVGGNGSLPTGQPITYNAQGSK